MRSKKRKHAEVASGNEKDKGVRVERKKGNVISKIDGIAKPVFSKIDGMRIARLRRILRKLGRSGFGIYVSPQMFVSGQNDKSTGKPGLGVERHGVVVYHNGRPV